MLQNTPSGIAQQLRKSSENVANINPEPMNIDDFIFSEDAATPAGISFSPLLQPNPGDGQNKTIPTAAAHGIPIKSRKDPAHLQQQAQQQQLVPQSVPEPPHHQSNEFHYINRHHRKTSIDDRRVSLLSCPDRSRPVNTTPHLPFPSIYFPTCLLVLSLTRAASNPSSVTASQSTISPCDWRLAPVAALHATIIHHTCSLDLAVSPHGRDAPLFLSIKGTPPSPIRPVAHVPSPLLRAQDSDLYPLSVVWPADSVCFSSHRTESALPTSLLMFQP